MTKENLIMVIALVGWGLFVGTMVTKQMHKCECPSVTSTTVAQ